jgi:hypothetical protein
MHTIILKSTDRINNTTTANDAQFYIDWGSILEDGKYRVSYSICKQLIPVIPEIPWTFKVKSSSLTVPTTVDGFTLTNTNVSMINDTVRGSVFNFTGANYLSINVPTPVNSTKTFWVMMPNMTLAYHNVFSSSKMPVWFNTTTFLRASVNFGVGGGGEVISTIAQTAGVWKHYAITTTATQTLLYVDGILVKTGNITWGGDTALIYFGAYLAQSPYTGRLDDMRLYSSTLSASDINSIYTRTLI